MVCLTVTITSNKNNCTEAPLSFPSVTMQRARDMKKQFSTVALCFQTPSFLDQFCGIFMVLLFPKSLHLASSHLAHGPSTTSRMLIVQLKTESIMN
jgi:hypothetical protein